MKNKTRLIIGGLLEERVEIGQKFVKLFMNKTIDLDNPPPDVLIIKSKNSVGINQARFLKQFLSLKPYQEKVKIGLILEAEKLTLPAQSSLLKTLEEPPEHSLIILLAGFSSNLLPAIISRLEITRLPSKSQIRPSKDQIIHLNQLLSQLLTLGAGERLKLSLSLVKNKQEALDLVENLLYFWRQSLLVKTGVVKEKINFSNEVNLKQIEKAIKNTEQVRKMIDSNVNFRLAIENLFLSYPYLRSLR